MGKQDSHLISIVKINLILELIMIVFNKNNSEVKRLNIFLKQLITGCDDK